MKQRQNDGNLDFNSFLENKNENSIKRGRDKELETLKKKLKSTKSTDKNIKRKKIQELREADLQDYGDSEEDYIS